MTFPKKGKVRRKTPEQKNEHRRSKAFLASIRELACIACGKSGPSDPDHIATRGSGGKDTVENLWPLCRAHHRERHDHGLLHMSQKYSSCDAFLRLNGWMYDSFFNKWTRAGGIE